MANGNGKKKRKKIILVSAGLAAGVILLLILVAAKSGGTIIDKSKIGDVKRETLAKNVVATGKITPIVQTVVKSKASGIVKKWYKDAGQPVKAGEVLVELDKEEILTHVHQAEADLQAAEASRSAAQADVGRATVDAEGPDVPLLKRNYERAQQMAKEGVFSQSQLEDAEKNYELALNKQNVARANLIVAKAKLTQEIANVAKARAALEQNRQEYQYSTIVAPIDGIVLSRDVEVGDAVSSILVMGSAATQVMTIGDIHEVYVLGKVDESDIGSVTMNQPARIKVESFKDKTFNGRVTKIAPMGVEKDNVTTFEVRVSIDNPGGELKTTMTANAEIILEEHPNVLTVPEAAIIYDKDKNAFVEVVDPKAKEGKRKISITAGISNGSKTEVLSGLKENEQVVLQ
ncbi:MAG TPA: efflux RND transporter periplasmic adaptor subunit [Terriglobales bacterium]|jgi:HlyD family secretion protein|nr:efflux RND transporter periplasmic adaptor subunit [Terriglobales bacterium]